MNTKQLQVRKDGADLQYATLDPPKSEMTGDYKWFLKRKKMLD